MKFHILFLLIPFLFFGCSSEKKIRGLKVSTLKSMTTDIACMTIKRSKDATIKQFAEQSIQIFKKHGIDPSNKKQMNNAKLALEDLKKDEGFMKDLQNEIMTRCLN